LASAQTVDLDKLIERLDSEKLTELSRLLDHLHTVNYLLDRLKELSDTGAIDTALNLAYTTKVMKDMLNDEALSALSKYVSTFLEAYPSVMEYMEIAMSDVPLKIMKAVTSEEVVKSLESPPQVKLGSLLKWMSDPDVQRGLGVLMVILKAIGKQFAK
jgi:uncharacterized protein YjgD (DUF1641 family)